MSPPPSDDKLGHTTSDSLAGSISNSGGDVNTLDELAQGKTCDAPCCEHSHGCHCGRCFCQVRTDIPLNENQTTYGSEGGEHDGEEDWDLAESSVPSTGVTDDDVVHLLTTNPWSSDTNAASSPINIAPSSLHPNPHARPLSLGDLRTRDAAQSPEVTRKHNLDRYMSSLRSNITLPERASVPSEEIEHPEKEFISRGPLSDCDCELIFPFESNENSRCNSNALPSDILSSQGRRSSSNNPSVAVRLTGEQFDSASIVARSQYSVGLSLCYSPLVLVPEYRRAANCA